MRLALDTNILVYAEGANGAARRRAALEIIAKLPEDDTFIPVQALGELFQVLVRKAGRPPERARIAVLSWQDAFSQIETSTGILVAATDLAVQHRLSIWDSVILSAASAAGCRLLLSEELQEGFTWGGVTVANPFSENKLKLLSDLLE
jgi:predicted nucleic acid-binding protein